MMRRALLAVVFTLSLSACQPYGPLVPFLLGRPSVAQLPPVPPAPAPPTTVLIEPVGVLPVSGACGGELPPCWVMIAESGPGGNPLAVNEGGCGGTGCYGKWQASMGTWNRYDGYERADLAPESVQDDFARDLWNNGRGCSHWNAC